MIFNRRYLTCIAAVVLALPCFAHAQKDQDAKFTDVEIRVIRPKFFQKSVRVEMGASVAAVMNQAYTYTYMPSAKLGLHLLEWLELFGEGALGITINKSDCTDLGSKFAIEPVVQETENMFGGGAALTPIYGKYQLGSGDVIYFDWFLIGGGGIAGMRYREQGCKQREVDEPLKVPKPYSTVQFNFGTGQRFFLNKNVSLNWYLRDHIIMVKVPADSEEAVPSRAAGTLQSVTLSFGASYYF
jgi:outer membrane beta-barrel protein